MSAKAYTTTEYFHLRVVVKAHDEIELVQHHADQPDELAWQGISLSIAQLPGLARELERIFREHTGEESGEPIRPQTKSR